MNQSYISKKKAHAKLANIIEFATSLDGILTKVA